MATFHELLGTTSRDNLRKNGYDPGPTPPSVQRTSVDVQLVPQAGGIRSSNDATAVELFRDMAKLMLERDPSVEAAALLVVAAHKLPTGHAGRREMCTWIRHYRETVLAKRRNNSDQSGQPLPIRRRREENDA